MKVREVFISFAAINDRAACERYGGPQGVVRAILKAMPGRDLHYYAGREPHEAPAENHEGGANGS